MPDPKTPLDQQIRTLVEDLGRRIVTTSELRGIGATKKTILTRCQRGTLSRLHDGVYLVGAGSLTWQEEIHAGVLAGGDTARASHFSVLRLFDLGNFQPRPIHVTVDYATTLHADGVTAHRTRRAVRSTVVDGVPVVCVEEALLGAAPKLSKRELHRLLTAAWRRRLTTPRKVLLHLERHGVGVKGREKLQAVAELYAGKGRGPGSDKEADFIFDFFEALDAHGIERPELQFSIKCATGGRHGRSTSRGRSGGRQSR